MSRRVRRVFEPRADQVAAARGFVRGAARRWGFEALEDAVLLVASELATNAVVHAATPFAVCVRQAARGLVVEVSDANPRVPTALLGPRREDNGGRGLGLVAACAIAWGVRRTPDGKAIWAQLCPMTAPSEKAEESMSEKNTRNDQSFADPEDLAFGRAAKEKEDTLDKGPSEPLEEMEETEEPPRAGGKAEPSE